MVDIWAYFCGTVSTDVVVSSRMLTLLPLVAYKRFVDKVWGQTASGNGRICCLTATTMPPRACSLNRRKLLLAGMGVLILKNANIICLLADWENQRGFDLVQRFDPEGKRTIQISA